MEGEWVLMHATIEELRELAGYYIHEKRLDDKQLAVKKHIADCDECYHLFCAEYLLQKELIDNSLITADVWEETENNDSVKEKFLIQIRNVKGTLKVITSSGLQGTELWNFFRLPQVSVVRNAPVMNILENAEGQAERQESTVFERFESKNSQYSHITYDGTKTVIQLDGDVYPVDRLVVLVRDGKKINRFKFQYEDETECYQAVVNHNLYSDEMIIEIIEDKNGRG